MKLYRTSVKEDLNVAVVFQHLAENYVNKVKIEKSGVETFTQHLLFKRIKLISGGNLISEVHVEGIYTWQPHVNRSSYANSTS